MMKKVLLPVLAAILLSMLAGCGQPSAVSSAAAPTYQEQYDLGVKYLSEGNYQEAVAAFTAAIDIEANHAEAYTGRGDGYVGLAKGDDAKAQEKYRSAEPDYLKAIELDAKQAAAYGKLADVYIALGENDKAREILQKGVDATGDTGLQDRLKYLGYPAADEAVEWTDPAFEALVRKAIHIPEGTVYTRDLDSVWKLIILGGTHVYLNKEGQDASGKSAWGWRSVEDPEADPHLSAYYRVGQEEYTQRGDIRNVDSLRYFRNLSSVNIVANQITDVSVLGQMPNLTWANFFGNDISDLSPVSALNGDLKNQEQFIKIGDPMPADH
jgi:tetratricopeptide (TPR) repeat protein